MWCSVAIVRTDVSEYSTSIVRVTRIDELGTTLAVNSNLRTLRRNFFAACFGCCLLLTLSLFAVSYHRGHGDTSLPEPHGITSQNGTVFKYCHCHRKFPKLLTSVRKYVQTIPQYAPNKCSVYLWSEVGELNGITSPYCHAYNRLWSSADIHCSGSDRFINYSGKLKICKIWGFHGGDYEEWCLLGCYAVLLL
jgi:hypothetical protein